MERPFPAYRGASPFIFVSYSHADEASVFKEMVRLHEARFPIWFDEGIRPGSRWSDELAERIGACDLFLIFITPHSAKSQHCLRELNYAQTRHREVLAVHLDETELSPGLDLALSDRQAILKYRLSSDDYVEKLLAGVAAAFEPGLPREDLSSAVAAGHRRRHSRTMALATAATAFLAATGAVYYFTGSREAAAPISPPVAESRTEVATAQQRGLAIAVLPFVNMSNDPDNEYFSDGMSEEILNALVKTGTIDVIARTSSFQFKGKNLNMQDIGTRLNATHVLEGSVRKAGNQVRITAQLIDARSGVHLWSESFDRFLDNVFAMQDEIAAAIVLEIGSRVGSSNVAWSHENLERRGIVLSDRKDTDPQAYELYLRAVHEVANVGTTAAYDKALALLHASTEIDAEFSAAWRTIGLIQWLRFDLSPRDNAAPTLAALDRALAVDPDDAAALSLKGYVEAVANLRWREGEAMARRAVELAPSDAEARTNLAQILSFTNRTREALSEVERAYRLDPLNVYVASQYAGKLFALARHQDAADVMASIEGVVQMHPMAWSVFSLYSRMGNVDMTRKYAKVVQSQFGEDSGMGRWAEVVLARTEDPTRNDELAGELDRLLDQGIYVPRTLYSTENFREQAESAARDRWFGAPGLLLTFARGPEFDDLRRAMRLEDFEVRDPVFATAEEVADYERRRVVVPIELLDRYAGVYVNDRGWVHEFHRAGNKLILHFRGDGYTGEVIPLAQHHFVNSCCIAYYYTFVDDGKGSYTMTFIGSQIPDPHRRAMSLSEKQLDRYTGRFISTNSPPVEPYLTDGKLMARFEEAEFELLPTNEHELVVALADGARVVFEDDFAGFVLTRSRETYRYARVH